MTTSRLRQVLDHLQQTLSPPGEAGLKDGQLLARFLGSGDEAAFAALVRRHGPMVLGVCRRILGHAQDAEDAFQATFLVLARKAGSVAKRDAVGNFLYGVAYRTALAARVVNSKRRARERLVARLPHPEVQPEEPKDWRPLLDGELSRLPDKYRAAVVLCDLEGKSRRAAAQQLKLPEGTLSSRLATARRLLAKRLARRGLACSGGALAALVAQGAVAAVPARLASATTKAAVLVIAGHLGAVSTAALVLTKGVLQAMFLAKLKVVLAVGLGLAVLSVGGIAYRSAGVQAGPPEDRPLTELEALRKENALLKLNLQVVLEKLRAQEAELRAIKDQGVSRPPLHAYQFRIGEIKTQPDPGNLTAYRNHVGKTYSFEVTGATGGIVWGSDVYTDDSHLATAAVHAGVLQPGQKGVIKVTVLAGRDSYAGTARNGVTTQPYVNWPGSYRIEMPAAKGLLKYKRVTGYPDLTQWRGQVSQTLLCRVTGKTTGSIWGTGIYTDDSDLGTAAVHAGILREGQTGFVKVTILRGQDDYPGSTRNGVSSANWKTWSGSYRIEAVKGDGPVPQTH